MSFPQTRHTLIRRIAADTESDDWPQFLADYWRPLCRFAARWGRMGLDEAEDVASATLEAVIRGDLLSRWVANRRARLRTLLCTVVRNILANRARHASVQSRHRRELAAQAVNQMTDAAGSVPRDDASEDTFYTAWAEELIQSSVEQLLDDYNREQRGDYFRVLHGRICDGLSMPEISRLLNIPVTSAENFYKHARKRLASRLEHLVREQVARYSPVEDASEEFESEWRRLGDLLEGRGGLEQAVHAACQEFDAEDLKRRENRATTDILNAVREDVSASNDDSDDTDDDSC